MNRSRSLLALAALSAVGLVVSLPALAGGPLAVFQSGQAFLWPGGGQNIPFNPDMGGLGGLTNAQAVLMTENAFGQWGAVATSTASYVNAGSLPVDVDTTNFVPFIAPVAPDGLSAIVFDEDGSIFSLLFGPGSGVLGFAGPEWVNLVDGTILEGLAFFNGAPLLVGSINQGAQRAIFVHEFGHYSNLAHTVVNGEIAAFGDSTGPSPFNTFTPESLFQRVETMYPFALILPGGVDFGGGETPHRDDISILSTLYPAPGFSTDFGTITGTILAPNGVTKITGVNVIARNVANPYDDAVSAISSDFTDNFSQLDAFTGVYTLNGLTPGADYAVFVDQILAGGFSTPPLFPLLVRRSSTTAPTSPTTLFWMTRRCSPVWPPPRAHRSPASTSSSTGLRQALPCPSVMTTMSRFSCRSPSTFAAWAMTRCSSTPTVV